MKVNLKNSNSNSLKKFLIVSIILNLIFFLNIFKGNDSAKMLEETNLMIKSLIELQKKQAIDNYLALNKGDIDEKVNNELENEYYYKTITGDTILDEKIKEILKKEIIGIIDDIADNHQGNFNSIGESIKKEEVEMTKETKEQRKLAYENSMNIINTAVTNGIWTKTDVQEIRMNFNKLSNKQKDEMHSILLPAINRGEIKVESIEIF